MKKSIGATVVSLAVLLLIGTGLYFWAYYPGQREVAKEKEAELQLAQGEESKETDVAAEGEPGELENSQVVPQGEPGELENSQAAGEGELQKEENAEALGTEGEEQTQEPEEVTLVFTGDIYLSPHVQKNYDTAGISGVVSEQLLAEMKSGDITVANEEFPFSTGGTKVPDKQFTFRVDPSYTSILTDMGIDIVGIANNHALDYGAEALTDTFGALDAAGIAYIGAGADKARAMQPDIVQVGQRSFGFLAASRVIPVVGWNVENQQPGMLCTYDSKLLCQAIQEAKKECDFLTVYVHWGIEKSTVPEAYQKQLAREYIDAGADLVIGSHPHVLQGIEYYNGKPIVYSLGNYIFNQEIASTVLLKVKVTPENEAVLQLIAASASGARTQEMSSEKAAELYHQIESISYEVGIGEDGVAQPK